ncbi:DUF4168 domain-containing protein [Acidiphilium sp. AL]|nr:DUF4168 domain-containing protein [Acidiphilium sp. AL]
MAHRTRTLPFAALAAGLIATPMLAGTALAQMTAPAAPQPRQSTGMMPAHPLSHATIAKAGHALRKVVAINKMYGDKLAKTTDPAAKQQLVATAKQKAMGAITRQGLTVGQYDQVLASAEQNPAMRQQLLSAAGISAKN